MSIRDRVILTFYLLVGLYAFVPSTLGPLVPFLRGELSMDYTVTSLHFAALYIGVILAGSTGDKIIRRLTRPVSLWGGAGGLCLGIVLLVTAHHPLFTICSAFLIGACGSLMGQTIDTVISEQLGDKRAVAFTEANVISSSCALVAPMAVSLSVSHGLNWRTPLYVIVVLFALAFLCLRHIRIPAQIETDKQETMKGTLPIAYWAYWLVILFGCASEWSIVFWSADFLCNAGHMAKEVASGTVSAFFLAMIVSRVVGSALSHKLAVRRLLPFTTVFALFGFLVFWLGLNPVVHVFGLFLAGLGIANIYPYTLSAALGVSPTQSALAASRMNIATGASGLFGPMVLGCLADRVGIFGAYGIVAVLLTLALTAIFWANSAARVPQPVTGA